MSDMNAKRAFLFLAQSLVLLHRPRSLFPVFLILSFVECDTCMGPEMIDMGDRESTGGEGLHGSARPLLGFVPSKKVGGVCVDSG